MQRRKRDRLWFGGCCYCGRWHSNFGLGLITTVYGPPSRGGINTPYRKMVPYRRYCIECEKIHHPGSYTLDMRHVFEQVDRIPWVPTEREAEWWRYWNIDHWFARRRNAA